MKIRSIFILLFFFGLCLAIILALTGCTSAAPPAEVPKIVAPEAKPKHIPSAEDLQKQEDFNLVLDIAEDHVKSFAKAQLEGCDALPDSTLRTVCKSAILDYWTPALEAFTRIDKDPCARKVCL